MCCGGSRRIAAILLLAVAMIFGVLSISAGVEQALAEGTGGSTGLVGGTFTVPELLKTESEVNLATLSDLYLYDTSAKKIFNKRLGGLENSPIIQVKSNEAGSSTSYPYTAQLSVGVELTSDTETYATNKTMTLDVSVLDASGNAPAAGVYGQYGRIDNNTFSNDALGGIIEVDGKQYKVFKFRIRDKQAATYSVTLQAFGTADKSTPITDKYQFFLFLSDDEVPSGSMALSPQVAKDLTYTGAEQVGIVASDAGYTLSGVTAATNAGSYTATATLDSGYLWMDGTAEAKQVEWSIGQATLQAKAGDLQINAGETPNVSDVPVTVTGFQGSDSEESLASAGFVRPTVKFPEEALEGGHQYDITLEGGNATPNYTFEYTKGTLTVVDSGLPYPESPSDEAKSFTYDGQVHTYAVAEDAGYTIVYTDASGTVVEAPIDVGMYTVVAKLKDGEQWALGDDRTADYAICNDWTIKKAPLAVSYVDETIAYGEEPAMQFSYEGFVNGENEENLADEYFTAPHAYYYGDLLLGENTMYVSGCAAKNYEVTYYDGKVTVNPIGTVELPSNDGIVYDGAVHEFPSSEDFNYVVRGDAGNITKGTDAGAYSTKVDPKAGYVWADTNASGGRDVEWVIARAPLTATYAGEEITADQQPELKVGVTGFVNGETDETAADYVAPTIVKPETLEAGKSYELTPTGGSAKNYEFKTYTAGTLKVNEPLVSIAVPTAKTGLVYSGKAQIGVAAGTGYTVSGGSATDAGSYTATAKVAEGYQWTDGTTADKVVKWSIAKSTVKVPTAKTGLVYNGKVQTGVAAGTGYKVTGNTATNAGSYTATLTAAANYQFEGANATADVKWSIAKAKGAIAAKAKSKKAVAIKAGKSLKAAKVFKVTKNTSKGKVTYKKTKGNKKITVAKNGKVTVKKGLKKGKTYTIKVKATSAATANYNAATSKVITVKIKVK